MSSDRPPLLPDDWGDLAPLVDRLLDTPFSERAALLAELAGDNPARRAELEKMLAECERDLPLLERPALEQFPELLEETEPPLPEVLGGRYRIERELGRGGMARVYLAHDLKHARPVAVKVIRHELTASMGRERFLREIGIAARLRHPNIMPLYDSGDADGVLFFVMPYEGGKSLRARLDQEPRFSLAEGVSILRDIARALACAHEQSVVHRDIKPDNVLLSGDAAVVTDFGIAKAFTAAAAESGTGSFTHAGTVIGTPAYMSPEQAMGDPATDHRTDIYAFGCLAYELFASEPPFTGTTTYQVLSAQISRLPKPLRDHRPEVPEELAHLIARCLEKDPDQRPANATALLEVLGTPSASRETASTPRPRSGRLAVAVFALLLLVVGGWYATWATRGGPVTIAVLPLEVTGDSGQTVAAGFGEDLATELVKVPWLLVKSRGGARNYSGRGDLDPRTTSDSLGVRYLVMGSLRRDYDASSLSLTLQLVRGDNNEVVWAEQFPHPIHLKALRNRIVQTIAERLRPAAGRFARSFAVDTTRQQYGIDDDAYTLYLKGMQKLTERGPSVGESIALFRQAIGLDSTSAEAWSGLSLALALSVVSQLAHVDSIRPEATASAKRALRLDSTLPEPHIALGVVHALDWQWREAETESQTALHRNPHDVDTRIQYARLLIDLGRLPEAIQQIQVAHEADPASSMVLSFMALTHLLRGTLDSALVWSDRAMRSNSSNLLAHIFRGMLFVRLDRRPEARQLVQNSAPCEPYSLYVLAASGDSAAVRERLAALAGPGNRCPAAETARAYALLGLGDTAPALEALEQATDRREIWPLISYPALPTFDAVRENPRFQALLRRVGLPSR